MWHPLCDIYSPNAEKEETKTTKAEDKYYKYSMVRYILRKIKRGEMK